VHARRFRRLRQRALRLNELVERCRQSGQDPAQDPEVTAIRQELAADYPNGAKTLLDKQEAVELELLRALERWYGPSPREMLNRLLALTLRIRGDTEQQVLADALQDPHVVKLLADYAEVTETLRKLLAKEQD
jgi:hypothetical protein